MSSRFLKSNGPLDPGHMMRTLGIHSIPTLDIHEPAELRHTRVIAVDSGPMAVELAFATDGVQLSSAEAEASDLDQLETAVRAWLDLDTDLSGMQESFSHDPMLGALVAARPWLRLVGYLNGFEAAATTVLGQQVTLAAGRTFGGRFLSAYGSEGPGGLRIFPTPEAVVAPGVDTLRETIGLTKTRAATLFLMAQGFAAKGFAGTPGIPLDRSELLALRGVGPWTADYLQMRGRSDPDAFVPGDLVARRALDRITEREAAALASSWAPYRSYAMVHLWASDTMGSTPA
ncbi:3-methyladenine DNA glycosylase 2 [Arthrobacter sp. AQ5-05]|uniref:DNA-3-methyladenine glycosylase family protein n=1 Tax=Arthrobacter sp. AQ5-05 TaxID=2184581 RepID=UPI000DCDFA47|nr:AlkA N-terminal domain-containing protein [Arthrobacter sp. AQ5-05]RAX47842.1 3-methyladenine DNA glycosylase 2 [Arthrobacter sp. AQ5-05]